LTHFFHAHNALIGELLAHDGEAFRLYRSTTESGHIFYRNLRCGDIPNLPVVLVLNKPYARIEKEVAKDRDRKAFGEPLREAFYGVWAKGFFGGRWNAAQHVIKAAEPLWQRGTGHPLLAAIARATYYGWDQQKAKELFGDGYFAESHSHLPAETLQFSELEAGWCRKGRVKLPSYFESFGVVSAWRRVQDITAAAREEARKQGARRPTSAENEAIGLLRSILYELTPR
jgi:hypothetical protein